MRQPVLARDSMWTITGCVTILGAYFSDMPEARSYRGELATRNLQPLSRNF